MQSVKTAISADLNVAQPLKYDPFPSIHEDYSDRIEDLLSEVDLGDSVTGGAQSFTMSCLPYMLCKSMA